MRNNAASVGLRCRGAGSRGAHWIKFNLIECPSSTHRIRYCCMEEDGRTGEMTDSQRQRQTDRERQRQRRERDRERQRQRQKRERYSERDRRERERYRERDRGRRAAKEIIIRATGE